mmetsp:Transcript_13444/g.31610  ORF Transcript_13444/g.31610 Transcript_13444/m.31610 type:complete len:459 (-) Transcript_13444:25-1401(-)
MVRSCALALVVACVVGFGWVLNMPRRSTSSSSVVAMSAKGHTFPDSSSVAEMVTNAWHTNTHANGPALYTFSKANTAENHTFRHSSTVANVPVNLTLSTGQRLSVASPISNAVKRACMRPFVGRLCGRGKLLPNLYLLGAQKAASTELWVALARSGVIAASNVASVWSGLGKEHMFWGHLSSEMTQQGAHNDGSWNKKIERKWYGAWPPCGAQRLRGVRNMSFITMLDASPNNLWMTELGEDLTWCRKRWSKMRHDTILLPPQLASLYGPVKTGVTFIVSLREPLSRMQAGFYQQRAFMGDIFTPANITATFAPELKIALDLYDQGEVTFFLWGSLYGRQLEFWFQHFAAEQFVIFPWLYFLKKAQSAVSGALWHAIHRRVDCQSHAHANGRKHMRLDVEVPPNSSLRVRAEALFAKENLRLFGTLREAYLAGACMPASNFTSGGTEEEIEHWLSAGW